VAVAIVAAYIALHWAITAIEVLHEQNRFREAPAFAADMVGAVDEEWLVFRTSGVIPEPELYSSSAEKENQEKLEKWQKAV
jgi:hypothetical protein